mgnify:CR=1 FL=1
MKRLISLQMPTLVWPETILAKGIKLERMMKSKSSQSNFDRSTFFVLCLLIFSSFFLTLLSIIFFHKFKLFILKSHVFYSQYSAHFTGSEKERADSKQGGASQDGNRGSSQNHMKP